MDKPPVSSRNYLRIALISLVVALLIIIVSGGLQYWIGWN